MPSVEQLERLEALDPKDPFIPYARALEHAKAGDHDSAIAAFDRCLTLDADYLYAYFHKARSLEAEGRIDDAKQTLTQGAERAAAAGDAKASSEIAGFLHALEP